MKQTLVLLVWGIATSGLVRGAAAQAPAPYAPQYMPAYQPVANYSPAGQYPPGPQYIPVAQSAAPQPAYAYPTTAVAAAPAVVAANTPGPFAPPPPATPTPPGARGVPCLPSEAIPMPPQNVVPSRSLLPQNGTADCENGAAFSDSPYETCYDPAAVPSIFGDFGNSYLPRCGPAVTVGGVIFTRGKPEFYQMSFDDTDLTGAVISSTTGTGKWDGGPEIRIVWPLGSGRAIQGIYWGLYGSPEEATVYGADLPGNLNTTFDLSLLNIGTNNVNDLYDGAAAHRLRRDYDVHNVELNFLYGDLSSCGNQCLQVSYLAGFRYLRYSEDFQYASADTNPVFGADPANEAYYDIDLTNSLFGVQLGLRADWYFLPKSSLYGSAKFGIYDNYIKHHSVIYNNVDGIATYGTGNPLAGQAFDIVSNTNVAATIGELDLGVSHRFGRHWDAAIGYRLIGVSGIAIPTNQVPSTGRMPGVEGINHNSTMLLHGAYASIAFGW